MDARRAGSIAAAADAPEALESLQFAGQYSGLHSSESERDDTLGPVSGLAAVVLVGLFAFLVPYCTQPLLPLFQTIFHAGHAAVSATVSATALGVAISAPWIGWAAQRLGRKRVVVGTLLVLSVPTLLAATSPSLRVLVFWRLVQGLVLPGVFATAITYVTEEWGPRQVPVVMSLYVSGTVLGGFLGRFLSGEIAERFCWQAAFLTIGTLLVLGAGVIAWKLPREKSVRPDARQRRELREPRISIRRTALDLLRPKLLAVYAVGFGMLFSLVAVFTYVTFYLAAPPFRLGTAGISRLFAIYLVGIVVTPAGGRLMPRIGLRRGVVAASVLLFCGAFVTLIPHVAAVLAGLAMVSSGVFITQAAAASYLRVAAPSRMRAMAAGAYLSAYYLGGSTGGLLPAVLYARDGWRGCVLLVAAFQVVCMAAAWFGWE